MNIHLLDSNGEAWEARRHGGMEAKHGSIRRPYSTGTFHVRQVWGSFPRSLSSEGLLLVQNTGR